MALKIWSFFFPYFSFPVFHRFLLSFLASPYSCLFSNYPTVDRVFFPLQQAPQSLLHGNHPQLHWSGETHMEGRERPDILLFGEVMICLFTI